jgi:hypothetical protein
LPYGGINGAAHDTGNTLDQQQQAVVERTAEGGPRKARVVVRQGQLHALEGGILVGRMVDVSWPLVAQE